MSEITIDTAAYELKTGRKPVGRAFRICSDSDTIGFQPATPLTYDAAIEKAKDRTSAPVRGS